VLEEGVPAAEPLDRGVGGEDDVGRSFDDALRGHGDVAREAGIDVLATREADHGAGCGDLASHQHGCFGRLQDEQDAGRCGGQGHQLLRRGDVSVELGDQGSSGVFALEDASQGGDQIARCLHVVVVGQQEDGDASVVQLLHHLGRAGLLVADDEAGILRQHRLRREEPVVAEVGLVGQWIWSCAPSA